MLTSRHFFTLLVALIGLAGCERNRGTASRDAAPVSSSPAPTTARPAVATVGAGEASTNFALVVGACTQKPCAAEIELVADGARLDSVPLEFPASDAKLVAKTDDTSFTIGAPLTTYTAGEEEGAVTTAIQPVRLSAQRIGLLVQQSGGFEHVKRRRDLFIVDDKKLKRVWSKQDGSGPVRSYADVVAGADSGGKGDEIVLIEGITVAPNEADQVSAQRLLWDEAAKTLRSTPVASMTATVVGNFTSAEAARGKYSDACFANFWLLRAHQVGEKSNRFVLAKLTPESLGTANAPSVAEAGGECSPKDVRRTAQFHPINDKK